MSTRVRLDAGSKDDLMKWVRWAAESVTAYYGRFPVPQLLLRIVPSDGNGVRSGRTFGRENGGFITIHVGKDAQFSDLARDWMLTHEMVHLSFPSVAENHHWIEEGIATYVEPIARVRAGHFDANQMWFEVMRDLASRPPRRPETKASTTPHTWGGRTGAAQLFCFLADVEIHRETGNKKGLEDALRGILNAGGDIRHDWELEKALTIGDQATGVSVLQNLYAKMKDQPYNVDLPALWTQLGIERDGNAVKFLDTAPLAKTREAITFRFSWPFAEARSQRITQLRDFRGSHDYTFSIRQIRRLNHSPESVASTLGRSATILSPLRNRSSASRMSGPYISVLRSPNPETFRISASERGCTWHK